MTRILFIKLLRDMRTASGRILTMIVAISLSLIAFSAMLYALFLVQSNMTSGYAGTNPASARITIDPGAAVGELEAMRSLAKAEPRVIDATMRSVFSLKIQKDGDDSTSLQLFAAAPDDPMNIAGFEVEEGSWPPPPNGILIERSTLEVQKLKAGDRMTFTGLSGKPVTLKITGVVHDQSLAPAGAEGFGYISTDTFPLLGKEPLLDQLVVTIADKAGQTEPGRNRDSIVRTALSLADRVKEVLPDGVRESRIRGIGQIAVPPPYQHPHQQIATTILTALSAFGGLALLLSAILIATMFNGLLTQHIPQIGVMKAIGARSSRILQLYLIMIVLVAAVATALALLPGIALGRALAKMLLFDALNIDVTTLTVPWWIYASTIAAGILMPVLIALVPLTRASRRTVREALDDRGVTDRQGRLAVRLQGWLGGLPGIDRTLLMAFRNVFRRRARFLLSAGLLATAGAIFVGGLNLMAGFQAIPGAITKTHLWDVEVRLAEPASTGKIAEALSKVSGVARAEGWNVVPTSLRYPGKIDVTRTYPDQGHGSQNLTAVPGATSVFNPPPLLNGRWLRANDTDAIVLPQTVSRTLPDARVGTRIELPIGDRLTSWRVVGIVKELAGGSCPCVSQKGFELATGRKGQANLVRIVTDRHEEKARIDTGQAALEALNGASIKAQNARPIDKLLRSTEAHSNLLVFLILMISFAVGSVGLIGLGSMMSTNVIERTREFGVMSATGATPSTVLRIVVLEGIFVAVASCVAAIVPALLFTLGLGAGLGNLFFSAPIPFQLSIKGAIIWTVLVTLGAAIATLTPAYRAARLTVREALAYL